MSAELSLVEEAGASAPAFFFTVQRNFGRASRTGRVAIAGQLHIVVQSGLLDVRSSLVP